MSDDNDTKFKPGQSGNPAGINTHRGVRMPELLKGDVADKAETVLKMLAKGKVSASMADHLMSMLTTYGKLVDATKLAARVAALEEGKKHKPKPSKPDSAAGLV
jgi:hypothetical protein